MHAKEADVAKYKGRHDIGYGRVRAARLEKMKRLGLLDEGWKITPQAGNWATLDRRPWEARCPEVYAAMLDCMDQGIGRLVETLKKNGQHENTLILYLQDNGACAETIGRNGPFQPRADKPTLPPLAKGYIPPGTTRNGYPVREKARASCLAARTPSSPTA